MRLIVPLALLLFMGCSGSPAPPDRSAMPSGSEAITYDAEAPEVFLALPEGQEFDGSSVAALPVGIRVRVLDDPPGDESRSVRVRVAEGEADGYIGEVTRWNLRPVTSR